MFLLEGERENTKLDVLMGKLKRINETVVKHSQTLPVLSPCMQMSVEIPQAVDGKV